MHVIATSPATSTTPHELAVTFPDGVRTPERAEYQEALLQALFVYVDATVAAALRTRCTECGEQPAMAGTEQEHGMLGPWVYIGCEGYLLVDPNALGIDVPNWSPVQEG